MRRRAPSPTKDIGIESVETGVDWITHIAEYRKDVEIVDALATRIATEDVDTGSKRQDWRFQSYRGWRTARIRLGWHSGKALMQASGNSAEFIATQLLSSSGRTTRLDVQATVLLSQSASSFARRAIAPTTTNTRSPCPSQIQRGLTTRSDGLCIGTVGPRTAPRYLRVYDKGVETRSAPAGRMWRLELEAKYGLAGELWQQYRTQEDRRAWLYASLESQWKSSGSRWLLPECSSLPCAARGPKREPTSAVALAAWLRTTVAPTIPRVLSQYSPQELLSLLGIENLYSVIEETTNGQRE